VRFYNAWDYRSPTYTLRALEREFGLTYPNGQRWLDQRAYHGSPAYHQTRKLSDKLGRHPTVSAEICKMLVSPSRNPVHDQQYKAQLQYHKIPCSTRTIQKRLKACTNKGQRCWKDSFNPAVVANHVDRPGYILFRLASLRGFCPDCRTVTLVNTSTVTIIPATALSFS
jgi:hypothetical protein